MALGLVDPGTSDDIQALNGTVPEDTQKISTNIEGDGTLHHQDGSPNLVWSLMLKHLGTFIAGQCHSTYILQPMYYHIGCAFFLLAFLAPSHRYGAALYMRCMLVFGCILFAMWSYLTECRPDVLIWSAVFIMANLIHMVILICRLRPVSVAFGTLCSDCLNHSAFVLSHRWNSRRKSRRWVCRQYYIRALQATYESPPCVMRCSNSTSKAQPFLWAVIKVIPLSLATLKFAMQ